MSEPAAAATEAPATDPSHELDVNSLLNAADATPDEEVTEVIEPAAKPGAPVKPGAKPTEKPGEKKPAPAAVPVEEDDLSDLLAETATFTPETLKKGAARVVAQAKAAQELVSKSHKVWGTAEKHARKVERDQQEIRLQKQTFGAQVQQMNAAFNAVRTGDAKTALEGIRQLTGQEPIAWLESLNIHIASNGKKKPKAPEILELEARLERYEQKEREKAVQGEEREAQTFIAQRHQQLATLATESEEDFPLVAEFAAENPSRIGAALADIIIESGRKNVKVGDLAAVRMLEEQLQHQSELSERARQKREKRTAGSVPERGTGNPINPGTAQAPTVKGKSLSASALSAPAAKRELSDEELEEDSASFLPPALLNWSRGLT